MPNNEEIDPEIIEYYHRLAQEQRFQEAQLLLEQRILIGLF